MEFEDLLKFAEENFLLISQSEFNLFPLEIPQKTVPLDYILFESIEYPIASGITYNQNYNGDFLKKFTVDFTRHDGRVSMQDYYHEFKLDSCGFDKDDHGFICCGSGDGWSRYVHYDKLGFLPNFYFKKPENDEEGPTNEEKRIEWTGEARFMERAKFNRVGTDEEKELINNYTDEEIEKMIQGGKNLADFRRLVKSVLRKKNGMEDEQAKKFRNDEEEDEYYRITREENEASELQEKLDEILILKSNGSVDQKRIVNSLSLEEIENKFVYFRPCSVTKMVDLIIKAEQGDRDVIEEYFTSYEV